MPRFKKSVFLLCIVFCILAAQHTDGLIPDKANSNSINKKGITAADAWVKTYAAYDKALLNFIGTRPIEEIEIKKDENYVRFRRTLPRGESQIVIEVIDKNDSLSYLKWSKIQLNPACHPMFAFPFNEPECFKLIYSHQKSISSIEVHILMNTLAEKEFWELSPDKSPIRESNYFNSDAEHWHIEASSTYHSWRNESTTVISHSVNRYMTEKMENFSEIGKHIQGLVEDKFIFP